MTRPDISEDQMRQDGQTHHDGMANFASDTDLGVAKVAGNRSPGVAYSTHIAVRSGVDDIMSGSRVIKLAGVGGSIEMMVTHSTHTHVENTRRARVGVLLDCLGSKNQS